MKALNKLLAGTCAIALAASMVACSKTDAVEETTVADGSDNVTIEVDVSDITTSAEETIADETEASTEQELPVTNEKGEVTIEGATFDTMYGSQLQNYLNHQYYYDDIAIPKAEANFYFIHEFTELSQEAFATGQYPVTSEGFIDLAYEFTKGQLDNFSYSTFGDYFKEFSENQILSTYIVMDLAEEQGIELSEQTYTDIDDYIVAIKQFSDGYGLTIDEYLQIFYGPDCDEAAFRGILERYYLSILYSNEYVENYVFDDEELYRPKVCHALFMAIDGVASQEEMDIALEGAEAMLAECSSPDDIILMGNALYTSGTVAECAEYSVDKGIFVEEFEDWAWDESRQVGDMEIVKTVYGYHVMGYLGMEEISENAKANIALMALSDEVGAIAFSNVHEFYTPDEIVTPSAVVPTEDDAEETTSEVSPSLNLDEDGNIVVDITTAEDSEAGTDSSAVATPAPAASKTSPKKVYGIVAIVVGVLALGAGGVLVAKGAKTKKAETTSEDEEESEEN